MLSYSLGNPKELIIHVMNEADIYFKHSERNRIFSAIKHLYFSLHHKNIRVN